MTKTAYEEALEKGYWGSVPAETPATQPLTATGEPAIVTGQPPTVGTDQSQATGAAPTGDADGQGTPDGTTTPDDDGDVLAGDLDDLDADDNGGEA